jgi:hypothetical protein
LSLPELRVLATQALLHIPEGIFNGSPSGVGFDDLGGVRLKVAAEEIIVRLLPLGITNDDESN